MKKIIAIMLTCSLLGCLFVGCNSSADSTKDEVTKQDITTSLSVEETTEKVIEQDTTSSLPVEETTEELPMQFMATYSDEYYYHSDERIAEPINKQTLFFHSAKFIVAEQLASESLMISQDGYTIMEGDNDISNLVLPNEYNGKNIVSVYDCAYMGSAIESLDMPDTIEYIGMSSFSYCNKLKNITFGKNLKKIQGEAFGNCSAIENIEFNENLDSIWGSAFSCCDNLKKVAFNGNTKLIGAYSFSYCDSLETIEFKGEYDDLVIGKQAFAYDTNLKKVYLPEGTVRIGPRAFYNCENLEELHIPASVTRFEYNPNEEDEKEFGKQYVCIVNDILSGTDATIYAPKGSVAEQYAELTGREFIAE